MKQKASIQRLHIDLFGLKGKEELHKRLAEGFSFPAYYGANLDALYDLLTSSKQRRVLWLTLDPEKCGGIRADYIDKFLATINDVCLVNSQVIALRIKH